MREKAESNGQDLLVVDTGDRIEGNGLSDASEPKGKYISDIFKQQQVDVICTGNHELYKRNSSEHEYNITVPNFKDSYLSSNVDIIDPRSGKYVPLAPRFKKFATRKQGIRIIAFGFLFDFTENENNTKVQPVEQTVKEAWFQEAIRDREVDLFLVIGHVPVRSAEFEILFKTIRKVQWDTPIQFLGGHTHIRDYKKYDDKSYALESGRFMETIGFQSINGLPTTNKSQVSTRRLQFSRRYIDSNLYSFHHHTGLNSTTFPTQLGLNVSKEITKSRDDLHLDRTYGCASQDLWMSRVKYPGNSSIFSWMDELVLPEMAIDKSRANASRLVMINTGALRFDIFKGPFTRDSAFIVSPFTSGFQYVQDVPFSKAMKLIDVLNNGAQMLQEMNPKLREWALGPIHQQGRKIELSTRETSHTFDVHQIPMGSKPKLSPGYTTEDDAGSDGDDTEHSPIPFYKVPNVVQSRVDAPSLTGDPKTVDMVYDSFIEPWLLLAFRYLGLNYTIADTQVYMEGEDLTTLLVKWVTKHWGDDC